MASVPVESDRPSRRSTGPERFERDGKEYSASEAYTQNLETSTVTFATVESSSQSNSSTLPASIDQASSTTTNSPSPSVVPDAESDSDSPLDNAHFLSFEEWKMQNLARAGQSAEHVGDRHSQHQGIRKRPANINNALDSLGEDAEIELDFGGFVSHKGNPLLVREHGREEMKQEEDSNQPGHENIRSRGIQSRNRDAGTTSKERFNYASFDCAANVLKTNSECKGSSSILVENKDNYLLNKCSATNKFVIVELCSDILVDTIVLANFEFFSSMFRTFRVSVSDRYPVKMDRWKELGTFEAKNSRQVQAFLVENSMIWARYLRIEFLTHFGNEYYCPVSLLRIHGTTMMEEFKNHNEGSRGFEDVDEGSVEDQEARSEKENLGPTTTDGKATETRNTSGNETMSISTGEPTRPDAKRISSQEAGKGLSPSGNNSHGIDSHEAGMTRNKSKAQQSINRNFMYRNFMSLNNSLSICLEAERSESDTVVPSSTLSSTMPHSQSQIPNSNTRTTIRQPLFTGSTHTASDRSDEFQNQRVTRESPSSSSAVAGQSSDSTSAEAIRYPPTSSQPPPPPPTPNTQENFFKSIHKRLQLLEANATLSLQYIEDQSRLLRDAFAKVEKRQLNKTAIFLENLNATVLTELAGFRQQYDQIWQSTVLELETQREQSQQQILAVSARLSILADEIVFQKRMSIIQSILLLICLGLVIFSRYSSSSYFELPLVQSMLSRSPSSLRLPFESPLDSPTSSRPNSSIHHGKLLSISSSTSQHARQPSDDSTAPHSPLLEFSPPTPTSASQSDRSVTPPSVHSEDGGQRVGPIPVRPPKRPFPQGESLSSPAAVRTNIQSGDLDWHDKDNRSTNLLLPSMHNPRATFQRSSSQRGNMGSSHRAQRSMQSRRRDVRLSEGEENSPERDQACDDIDVAPSLSARWSEGSDSGARATRTVAFPSHPSRPPPSPPVPSQPF
ncbi:MAG: hypothetical protein M1837_006302 [Sclerophora amabilis]|nr:MAG: hypothetical protein M1837_006302 [Sclerophora amabilis]